MQQHNDAMMGFTVNFRLNVEDRRLLRECSRRHDMTMTDVVRMGIRKICGGVDQKPEQPSAA